MDDMIDETIELLDPYENPVAPRTPPGREPARPARRWGVKIGLAVGLAVSVGAAAGLGMVSGERLTPPGVRGIWVTDVEKYAGRAVQISADKILFYQGDSTRTRQYDIHAVRRRAEANGLRVELIYGEIEDPYTLTVTYRSSEDLRLVNQPEIQWSKQVAFPTLLARRDTIRADSVTGKMSVLSPELIYCITQVAQGSHRDNPVSCEEWMANRTSALPVAPTPLIADSTTWVDDPWNRR